MNQTEILEFSNLFLEIYQKGSVIDFFSILLSFIIVLILCAFRSYLIKYNKKPNNGTLDN